MVRRSDGEVLAVLNWHIHSGEGILERSCCLGTGIFTRWRSDWRYLTILKGLSMDIDALFLGISHLEQ